MYAIITVLKIESEILSILMGNVSYTRLMWISFGTLAARFFETIPDFMTVILMICMSLLTMTKFVNSLAKMVSSVIQAWKDYKNRND